MLRVQVVPVRLIGRARSEGSGDGTGIEGRDIVQSAVEVWVVLGIEVDRIRRRIRRPSSQPTEGGRRTHRGEPVSSPRQADCLPSRRAMEAAANDRAVERPAAGAGGYVVLQSVELCLHGGILAPLRNRNNRPTQSGGRLLAFFLNETGLGTPPTRGQAEDA